MVYPLPLFILFTAARCCACRLATAANASSDDWQMVMISTASFLSSESMYSSDHLNRSASQQRQYFHGSGLPN
jgi:hypothetical protein